VLPVTWGRCAIVKLPSPSCGILHSPALAKAEILKSLLPLTWPAMARYDTALMSEALPASIDPWQAVARRAVFTGTIPLTAFPRLRGLLVEEALREAPAAEFALTFERDSAKRPVVLGSVHAMLPLECQRCLGVMEHRVTAEILLLVTAGEAVAEPPEPYEALPVVADRVAPLDLIEDELLLALPQIPMHSVGACRAGEGLAIVVAESDSPQTTSGKEITTETGRRNPFAVLADWKPHTHN
jgi:uncharacterized protein